MPRHHTIRLIVTLAVLCLLLTLPGCTKKVVGQRGVYSPQQLPRETETPILDAIGVTGKREQR